jgi:GxxExxY protein
MKLKEHEELIIQKVINEILDSAKVVFQDLGEGWSEAVYQKAMEIELRERGIKYEDQRVLPIYYKDKYVVGEGIPDLIILIELESGKRVHIIIELKTDSNIKEDHKIQTQKYIKALKKSLPSENNIVYPAGFIINFIKPSKEKLDEEIIKLQVNDSTIQWLKVNVEI